MPTRRVCDGLLNKQTRTGQLLTLLLFCVSRVSHADSLRRDLSGAYVASSGFTLDPDKEQTTILEYASGYRWVNSLT